MFPEERRREIVAGLERDGRCLVADLARQLDVSEVTIRQDLDVLEKEGVLRRTHGGAILNVKIGLERPFQVEETSHKAEKERIGAAAADLVSSGDTLILDVGTTVTAAARKLLEQKKKPTVFTNGLNIAAILEADPEITTVVTGGTLRPKQHSLVNPFAEFILPRIHADLALIGVSGVDAEHGVTNVNVAEAEMKALFVKAARRRVVLADSSKIGHVALAKFAAVNEIDLLITDQGADPEEVAALRERGLEVKLV
ncbi:MAG TPA: DeoR/GlpR family DNA-binding transcription regulator [Anaeromyxobacter sp.]|nr:DeoR/GlpR family DNA-binding transcription regulator [Anaeromyxobacter sp.]